MAKRVQSAIAATVGAAQQRPGHVRAMPPAPADHADQPRAGRAWPSGGQSCSRIPVRGNRRRKMSKLLAHPGG